MKGTAGSEAGRQACVLATCVLAAVMGAPDPGLLKVPRVYNALITSQEPLLPSRAYSVSSPALLPVLPAPYVALPLAAAPELPPAANSSEADLPSTTAAPETAAKDAPVGVPPFPLAFYPPLGYSPFSYYPSILAYSYPYPLVVPLPHAGEPPAAAPQLPSPGPVKNNKPEDSAVPDVSPPPPPSGAARAGGEEA